MANRLAGFLLRRLLASYERHPRLFLLVVALYVLSPVDLFPEAFVGVVGYVDDLIVLFLPLLLRHYLKRGRPPVS